MIYSLQAKTQGTFHKGRQITDTQYQENKTKENTSGLKL